VADGVDSPASAFQREPTLVHADGVYVGLDEWRYLDDRALSASAFKKLRANAPDWWWEHHSNPLYTAMASDARAMGTAVHKAVLEGMDAYEAAYCVEPDKGQHPAALDTADDFRNWLRQRNEQIQATSDWQPPRKLPATGDAKALADLIASEIAAHDLPPLRGDEKRPDLLAWIRARNERIAEDHPPPPAVHPLNGAKDELVERVLEIDPRAPVWARIADELIAGRQVLKPREDMYVRLVEGFLRRDPQYAKLLSGGLPELTVFWTEEQESGPPVRMKSRIDYLRKTAIVDLKTFGRSYERGLTRGVLADRVGHGDTMQAVQAARAVEAAQGFLAEGKVHGAPEQIALLEKILPGEKTFVWLCVRVFGAPTATAPRFDKGTIPWGIACSHIEEAIAEFKHYRDRFGDAMWIRSDGVHQPDISDWPSWMMG